MEARLSRELSDQRSAVKLQQIREEGQAQCWMSHQVSLTGISHDECLAS